MLHDLLEQKVDVETFFERSKAVNEIYMFKFYPLETDETNRPKHPRGD